MSMPLVNIFYEFFRLFFVLAMMKVEVRKRILSFAVAGALIIQSFVFFDVSRILIFSLYSQSFLKFGLLIAQTLVSTPVIVYFYACFIVLRIGKLNQYCHFISLMLGLGFSFIVSLPKFYVASIP